MEIVRGKVEGEVKLVDQETTGMMEIEEETGGMNEIQLEAETIEIEIVTIIAVLILDPAEALLV